MAQSYEDIVRDRDLALEHFEYCVEHYGENDEDTIQAEKDYETLESQVLWFPTIQSARALSTASVNFSNKMQE